METCECLSRSWPIETLYILLLVSADIYKRTNKARKRLDLGQEAYLKPLEKNLQC